MFKRILIANRGEIAVRVIRACREMGIESIAVYADVDRETLAVRLADRAYELKGATPRAAYLDLEQIVKVAKTAQAEAIHPGYGFLSENAAFSQACADAGIVVIGPGPEAIDRLGNKNHAREMMIAAGLPILPGTPRLHDVDEALKCANEIGYPVLIKAAAGGGGRGMRKVESAADLPNAFAGAQSESLASFGSPDLFLEKYLVRPRHVEIQVLGDQHGHAVYLGERECSVQRRFQKMFEEAPSPALDEATRRKMGEAAANGARQVGYAGAGTFEFLVDENRGFYFLEVNTRLQVEHPVTEMVTGVDLVRHQIQVAAGQKLDLTQEDIHPRGHAMECRISVEDPFRGFLPRPGRVTDLRLPAGPGVRVDTHLYPGYEVPGSFDSMVAKLITWGHDREHARVRMLAALDEFRLVGPATTIPFHKALLRHPEFIAGNLSTHFLAEHMPTLEAHPGEQAVRLAALIAALEGGEARSGAATQDNEWSRAGRWAAVGLR